MTIRLGHRRSMSEFTYTCELSLFTEPYSSMKPTESTERFTWESLMGLDPCEAHCSKAEVPSCTVRSSPPNPVRTHSNLILYSFSLHSSNLAFHQTPLYSYFTSPLTAYPNRSHRTNSRHEKFRNVCISLAQWSHRSEVRLRTGLLGENPKNIRPLSETK